MHDLTLILPLYLSEHVYSIFLAPLLNSRYLQLSKYLTELSDAGHIFGAGVGVGVTFGTPYVGVGWSVGLGVIGGVP